MHEIKFKVWDKILQGWSKNTMGWYHNYNEGVVSPEVGNRYVFCQYIGFKDKNKKEIYHNYTVKIPPGWGGDYWYSECIAVVSWDAPGFYAYNTGDKYGCVPQDFSWEDVEIIDDNYRGNE